MSANEVENPIINAPYDEPRYHWKIYEIDPPEKIQGRRAPAYFYLPPNATANIQNEQIIGHELPLPLVATIRERLAQWRKLALRGEGGVTRVTMELLKHWRREGRAHPLFFAQLEAAETIIFLTESRADLLQGIDIEMDEPSADKIAEGFRAFHRRCCKMATGGGKTTVMAMLAAWSILNKVTNKTDARFSDAVLVVCPNVTIRERLAELNPQRGDAGIYATRDLVPVDMREQLTQGRLLTVNWHVFEPLNMQSASRVVKTGKRIIEPETIHIGAQNTTVRGRRYMTEGTLMRNIAAQKMRAIQEHRDQDGALTKMDVETTRYIESDGALVRRALEKELGGGKNILVFNDEAHHAYRLRGLDSEDAQNDNGVDDEEASHYYKSATVWVDGLDKIHKLRGINFCVDFSATPYFLGKAGDDTNRVFPWTVSDFGLQDAIESGLVKIPQLVSRDPSGESIPGYYNIWEWLLRQMTSAERGGRRGNVSPDAVLRYASTPLAILAGDWNKHRRKWREDGEARPPVFIVVCKTKKIADIVYHWLANENPPAGMPRSTLDELHNLESQDDDGNPVKIINTIRVYSDMQRAMENDAETGAKADEAQWMRYTLDTVGKPDWPLDRDDRPQYPQKFEALADKLKRAKHPPGRDIRCIVSVSMLTEGWDCNTVTHILGLRPFMSQLLCEQVVGRGLRRSSYQVGADGLMREEIAQILGVPLSMFTVKAGTTPPPPKPKRHHIHAVPQRAEYEIRFPRVESYQQSAYTRLDCDVSKMTELRIDGSQPPAEVEVTPFLTDDQGRPAPGPGKAQRIDLQESRDSSRLQQRFYETAGELVKECKQQNICDLPANIMFVQLARIVRAFYENKVLAMPPAEKKDVFSGAHYRKLTERIMSGIAVASSGASIELPRYEHWRGGGSTADVDYYTTREPYEARKSHINRVVPDTPKLEQQAAYHLDGDERVFCFAKNAGLGFAIPYFHNNEPHEYEPDFIVRLANAQSTGDDARTLRFLILETKGYDELKEIKQEAAIRWVNAVNADGTYGQWHYEMVFHAGEITTALRNAVAALC